MQRSSPQTPIGPGPNRRVKVALASGLLLLAIALLLVLLQSPISVAGSNGTPLHEGEIALIRHDASLCQGGEELPSGTTALRIWLGALTGPSLHLDVVSSDRVIRRATRPAGWGGRSVTIAIQRLPHAVRNAEICVSFAIRYEGIAVFGGPAARPLAAREDAKPLSGRFVVQYMRPGNRSWVSLASLVAAHLELGRANPGAWVVVATIALLAAIAALASGLVLVSSRE